MRSSSGPLTSTTLTRMATSPKRYGSVWGAEGSLSARSTPQPLSLSLSLPSFPVSSPCPRTEHPARPWRGQRPGARLLLSQALGPGYLGVRSVELVCPSPHIPIPFNKVPGRCFLRRGRVGDTRGVCLALVPSYQGRAVWSLKEGRQQAHRPVSFGPNTLLCVLKIVAIHIQKKKRSVSYTKKEWLEHSVYGIVIFYNI